MKRSIVKFINRLYYLGWATVVVGGILFINKVEASIIVTSIGGGLLVLFYLLSFIFSEPQEEVDWSLVYPELAGVEKDEGENKTNNTK
ncbi:MAG: hypothetical protein PHX84_02055 [Candidatus Shapirobacteria bacterium]|nr:hypothetical protein [Candidatus Shapirobacteria bacterium]